MVGISEVTAGAAAARDVPVVVFLSSWLGISANSRAHIQFMDALADDVSHMHAVGVCYLVFEVMFYAYNSTQTTLKFASSTVKMLGLLQP